MPKTDPPPESNVYTEQQFRDELTALGYTSAQVAKLETAAADLRKSSSYSADEARRSIMGRVRQERQKRALDQAAAIANE